MIYSIAYACMHINHSVRNNGYHKNDIFKGFPTIKANFFKLHFSFENGIIITITSPLTIESE